MSISLNYTLRSTKLLCLTSINLNVITKRQTIPAAIKQVYTKTNKLLNTDLIFSEVCFIYYFSLDFSFTTTQDRLCPLGEGSGKGEDRGGIKGLGGQGRVGVNVLDVLSCVSVF